MTSTQKLRKLKKVAKLANIPVFHIKSIKEAKKLGYNPKDLKNIDGGAYHPRDKIILLWRKPGTKPFSPLFEILAHELGHAFSLPFMPNDLKYSIFSAHSIECTAHNVGRKILDWIGHKKESASCQKNALGHPRYEQLAIRAFKQVIKSNRKALK